MDEESEMDYHQEKLLSSTIIKTSTLGLVLRYRTKYIYKIYQIPEHNPMEFHILTMFNHPNILNADIIGAVTFSGERSLCAVMKYCQILDFNLPDLMKIRYFIDICHGLEYLHQKNILHLDIKVKNIVVDNGIAKLIDFGSTVVNHNVHQQKYITINTRAPEIFLGQVVDFHTDIWSLGMTFFHLFLGDDRVYVDILDELCKPKKNNISLEKIKETEKLEEEFGKRLIEDFGEERQRMTITENIDNEDMIPIFVDTLQLEPKKRLTLDVLIKRLKKIILLYEIPKSEEDDCEQKDEQDNDQDKNKDDNNKIYPEYADRLEINNDSKVKDVIEIIKGILFRLNDDNKDKIIADSVIFLRLTIKDLNYQLHTLLEIAGICCLLSANTNSRKAILLEEIQKEFQKYVKNKVLNIHRHLNYILCGLENRMIVSKCVGDIFNPEEVCYVFYLS